MSSDDAAHVDKLKDLCLSYQFTDLLIECMLVKSSYLSFNGKYDLAIAEVGQAVSIANESGSPYLMGLVNNQLGVINFYYTYFDKAIEYFLKSAEFFKATEKYHNICNSIKNAGVAYLRKVDYVSAAKYLNEALEFARNTDLKEAKASTLSWLGILEDVQLNYDKAAEHLIESNNIYYELKNFFNYAVNLNIIAVSYMNTKPSRALEYLTEAKEIAKKYDYEFVLSDIYQNIGTIHYRKNEFDSALENYFNSLEQSKSISSTEKISMVYHSIGDSYIKKNQLELGLDYLYKALDLRLKGGDRHQIVDNYVSLADAHLLNNEDEKSLQACDKAMHYAAEFNDSAQLSIIYKVYFKYYEKQKKHQKAYEYYSLFCEESNKLNKDKKRKSLIIMQKKFELHNINRNAKLKEQEEAFKGSIAMAITANHRINQPLMVLQASIDLINCKLANKDIKAAKVEIETIQKMVDKIRNTLTSFRSNM